MLLPSSDTSPTFWQIPEHTLKLLVKVGVSSPCLLSQCKKSKTFAEI